MAEITSNMERKEEVPKLLAGRGLPDFKFIGPDEINQQIPSLLMRLEKDLSSLELRLAKKQKEEKIMSWEEVMTPLQQIGECLRWSWGCVSHLNSVCNSDKLREAFRAQQPEVIRFSNRLGQSQVLYKALCLLKDKPLNPLTPVQERIVEKELLSMNHRGVGLDENAQVSFNLTCERLAELSTTFSNNVLDSTKEWSLLIKNRSEVSGLPTRVLEDLANAARESGDLFEDGVSLASPEKGPWKVGLDMPRYIPFMTHAKNRELREILYKAYVSRASEGDLNNQPLIEEILKLRTQQAKCLGYSNWAELSLANKMADNVKAVDDLLYELKEAAYPVAQKELAKIKACAIRNGFPRDSKFAPWDLAFWSERLRQEEFELNQEALRPWFPLPQVLQGLFKLCNRLFEISIETADGEAPIWHEDVRFFKVRDKDGSPLAAFYLDPFTRPGSKRGGAWMDECIVRHKLASGENIAPVAYLICNQSRPVGEVPSLMSFEEVETLFHEFGHGLQHMLTTVDHPQAAGINNVEWDAVELPSQFMENWCLEEKTIRDIARHWQTGEPLPEVEVQKLKRSKTFNSGLATLRQVHFALTDIKLHSYWSSSLGITPDELRRKIATTTTVISPIEEDQFLCAFSHIFAGGYAAGYYSYKWAEVLSSDAFGAFEEIGLDQEAKIKSLGKLFRETILSEGGSRPPIDIFISFRNRPPNSDALIRHSGLENTIKP